jgi:hypothetical protein
MNFEFVAEVFEWRGPAPFYFAATPEGVTEQISDLRTQLSYGWGVIPAKLTIGKITVTTSLIPKNGSFYVPLKDAIRKPHSIEPGDSVQIHLAL